MKNAADIVMSSVLRVMQPLARLLIRHGVSYPAFVLALKRVFLDAARAELTSRKMVQTDSAITLLCGVHRRDVRTLLRQQPELEPPRPAGAAAQVIARWLSDADYLDRRRRPRRLMRGHGPGEFDTLVASVSSDVRPRALLDEMLRLGVALESDDTVSLVSTGFAPRAGLEEMAWLFAENVADHAAAAAQNLADDRNFLEQSVFVDEITADSARLLQDVSIKAWKQAFKTVMKEAQGRFDTDANHATPEERIHRVRFGVYFYSEEKDRTP
jgi:Family of unknown function (DUF6502)